MKYIFLIIGMAFLTLVIYKGYPIAEFYYHKYTASSKGLHTTVACAQAYTQDQKLWDIKAHLGKKVVVVFWSSYCPPCLKEIPKINTLYKKIQHNDTIELVSYALDLSTDKVSLDAFLEQQVILYPILGGVDSKATFVDKFKVFGAPSIWVIDEKGTIILSNARHIEEAIQLLDVGSSSS